MLMLVLLAAGVASAVTGDDVVLSAPGAGAGILKALPVSIVIMAAVRANKVGIFVIVCSAWPSELRAWQRRILCLRFRLFESKEKAS
jgi:hypothetical protein